MIGMRSPVLVWRFSRVSVWTMLERSGCSFVARSVPRMIACVNFARATRPSSLEAVTVSVDPVETAALQQEWDARGIPVPLKILESPYREVTKPLIDYVRNIQRQNPRDIVSVYIPEYVVGHWWEQLLHNQSALRLKGRLLFTPGVMVTSVPYQLESSDRVAIDKDGIDPRRRSFAGDNDDAA